VVDFARWTPTKPFINLVHVSFKSRLFLILWLAGLAGVLSFLLLDLSALIKAVPRPEGAPPVELPPILVLKLVSLIQPAVLMTLAVLVGVWLAERVGLHSPAAEAAARGQSIIEDLKPQIVPGVLAGLGSGAAIVLAWVVAKPFLSAEFVAGAAEFNRLMPAAMRLLYGGFTEELLVRWGVMTFLVWAAWRLAARIGGRGKRASTGTPSPVIYIGAIVISALLFGAGHLPIAGLLGGGLTLPLVIYVLVANSLFGIVAGFLYWKRGLEAAIIAHMFVHVVLIAAIALSL